MWNALTSGHYVLLSSVFTLSGSQAVFVAAQLYHDARYVVSAYMRHVEPPTRNTCLKDLVEESIEIGWNWMGSGWE